MQTIYIENPNDRNSLTGKPTSLTIGNFDGCHLGHQQLIERMRHQSLDNGFGSAALTLDPPPEAYFHPSGEIARLFTIDQKLRAFGELGVDFACVCPFTPEICQMSAEGFFEHIIHQQLNAKNLVVGYDFRFGRQRAGDTEFLIEACAKKEMTLTSLDPVGEHGKPVSSSTIRQALQRGSLADAVKMLGRPYALEGTIVRGDQRGRTIGFPTANMRARAQIIPQNGVYAGYACFSKQTDFSLLKVDPRARPAVVNIGYRPTVSEEKQLKVEIHVIGGDDIGEEQLYGDAATFYFVERLRAERKFSGPDELKQTIGEDVTKAKSLLRS